MTRQICSVVTLIASFVLLGCGRSEQLLKAEGDAATITMRDGTEYTGELLAVEDTAVACMLDQSIPASAKEMYGGKRFVRLAFGDIERIVIEGYANARWVLPVVIFELVPSALFAAAAGSAGVHYAPVLALTAIPVFITVIGFAVTTPPAPQAREPFTSEAKKELKRYSRFPEGLSPLQWEEFLKARR